MKLDNTSRGWALAKRLNKAIGNERNALKPGARDLKVLRGVDARGVCDRPLENVLDEFTTFLIESGRVYRYGNNIVMESGQQQHGELVPLSISRTPQPGARDELANLIVCERSNGKDQEGARQFAPPAELVKTLLSRKPTIQALPKISIYAHRPMFDEQFRLSSGGYDPQSGILVHAAPLEPAVVEPGDVKAPIRDRLPLHLKHLLGEFCFRSDADLANAVAVMLTGLLVNHFVPTGKPLALVDGNQRGVGKTLLTEAVSMVLDGEAPHPIPFTVDEEELRKSICATLRDSQHSTLIIDNARVRAGQNVSSPTLESLSSSATISLRILGKSQTFVCPNDKLWMITMNDTRANADLVSRGLPIRFHFDGDPSQRQFLHGSPVQYARDHRQEILAELAGMVIRWVEQGKPAGKIGHRFYDWARVVGGVLIANHLPEGLTNLAEAAAEFDAAADGMSALAEVAVKQGEGFVENGSQTASQGAQEARVGRPAADWHPLFQSANLLQEQLEASKSVQSRNTSIGKFMAPHIDGSFRIEHQQREGVATLRCIGAQSKRKEYYFEIAWEESDAGKEPDDQCANVARDRTVPAVALRSKENPFAIPDRGGVESTEKSVGAQQPCTTSGGSYRNEEGW